jgi:hypothetical protein
MKRISILLWTSFLLLALCTVARGQFMFSVRPQLLSLNGAAFGHKFPSDLALFGGMDYMHVGATVDASTSYSYSASGSSRTSEASLSLYNLFVGVKYFVANSGSAKGYIVGEVSKPFFSLSVETNGEQDPTIEQLSDNLSIWGVKAGFGGEYFFADDFSLGGEFGLRYFFVSTNTEQTSPSIYYIPNPPYYATGTSTSKTDVKLDLGLTYTMLTLNYYFR